MNYFLLLLLPVFLIAGEGDENTTDIFPRLINFLIFAGILYYLLADKIKTYFKDRELEVADKLASIQDKLKESKNEKEMAVKKITEAKESAKSILEVAKKEARQINDKIKKDLHQSIENLQKGHDERVEVEEKKMTKIVVGEIVDEMFKEENFKFENEDLLNIVKKKVA